MGGCKPPAVLHCLARLSLYGVFLERHLLFISRRHLYRLAFNARGTILHIVSIVFEGYLVAILIDCIRLDTESRQDIFPRSVIPELAPRLNNCWLVPGSASRAVPWVSSTCRGVEWHGPKQPDSARRIAGPCVNTVAREGESSPQWGKQPAKAELSASMRWSSSRMESWNE